MLPDPEVRVRRRGEGRARPHLLPEAILLHGVSAVLRHPHRPGKRLREEFTVGTIQMKRQLTLLSSHKLTFLYNGLYCK